MARVFTWRFRARSYELDAFGHVNNAVYHRYLEEGATRASADAGFGYDWYRRKGKAWVVRQMLIRYMHPLRYGEEVELRTWVSDIRRIYSHREYDLRRTADDQPIVRARAKWVFVNLDTIRPERIPPEADAAFEPTNVLDELMIHLRSPEVLTGNPAYVSHRRPQHYELDSAGHINNAVYLNWFEQAMFDAYEAAGWPARRMLEAGLLMVQAARDVEYIRPVTVGMQLRIESRPTEIQRTRGVWQHEIFDDVTGEVLSRDYSVGAFLDAETGRPRQLPDGLLADLVDGAGSGAGRMMGYKQEQQS
jgi:acyl-CoA thioester hydrolase